MSFTINIKSTMRSRIRTCENSWHAQGTTTPWNLKNPWFLMTIKNLNLWRFLRGVVFVKFL